MFTLTHSSFTRIHSCYTRVNSSSPVFCLCSPLFTGVLLVFTCVYFYSLVFYSCSTRVLLVFYSCSPKFTLLLLMLIGVLVVFIDVQWCSFVFPFMWCFRLQFWPEYLGTIEKLHLFIPNHYKNYCPPLPLSPFTPLNVEKIGMQHIWQLCEHTLQH